MSKKKAQISDPWGGWRPSTQRYDPKRLNYSIMHPAPDTPDELQWREWFGDDWAKEKAACEREEAQARKRRSK